MSGFTDNPYKRDIYTVKQFGEHTVKIAYCSTLRESGWEDLRETKKKGSVNSEKLDNNLSRAKATVKELALCNPWEWFCTFTIDSQKYDRYQLDKYYSEFAKFLKKYNERQPMEYKVKYVLIPEQHEDCAWHIHGIIKGINPNDIYINQNGYLGWKQYEKKFGFISFAKIEDIDRASSYILKYMTKDKSKNVSEINRHLYYCSKGLNRAVELYRGSALYHGSWDWEHPDGYCKIKTLDVRKDNISDYMEIYDNDNTAGF